ncbi:MAG: hypothetical protein IPO21_16540 [Bacteroidales bacterium]|nr:hypothetical protein [Bacteroidales bacterium]
MKHLLLLFLVPFALFGQKQASFTVLVSEAKLYLEEYYKLAPFESDYYAISNFRLTKQDLIELRAKTIEAEAASKSPDSVEYYVMFEFLQEKITYRMDQIVKHSDFMKHDIEKLFTGSALDIKISDDKKLFNLSFDENTGGTYKSKISFVYFTDFVNTDSATFDEFQMFFPSDGFEKAYTLTTDEGVKYVLTGMVQSCSLCFDSFVYLIKFSNNKFEQEFTYNLSNRDWEDGVSYNHETKTIYVDYHLDDLTTFCQCTSENEEIATTEEQAAEVEGSLCSCKYVFNGRNFDFVKTATQKQEVKDKE